MYGLDVPAPGRVTHLASDLFPYLAPFDRVRDRRTFIYKRFEDADPDRLRERLRRALAGQPAFEARVTDVQFFEGPPHGAASAVYLAVDSPGLLDLHRTLTDGFGAVEGIEGNDYVPHVTLTRGGNVADVRAIANQPLDPIERTVSQFSVYDSSFRETTASISLPA